MKKLKIGLAAYGASGQNFHAPFISVHPDFELFAVCERSQNKAQERYPTVKVVRTFAALIALPELDIVVINTPDTTHFEFAKMALEAGKHVIVEKPFVFTIAEGEELIELAKEKNRMLTIFQNRRWDSDFLTVKRVLASQQLGRLVQFDSTISRYRNQVVPNTWKEENVRYVGQTYNLGSHLVDQALQLFGKPDGVFARIARQREGSKIDDYFHIQLIYSNLQVNLSAGFLMLGETPRYVLHGTKGSFVKYGVDIQEDELKKGKQPIGDDWGAEPESQWGLSNLWSEKGPINQKIKSENGNYIDFYHNIADFLLRGGALAVSPQENLMTIAVLEAAFKSQEEGRIVAL